MFGYNRRADPTRQGWSALIDMKEKGIGKQERVQMLPGVRSSILHARTRIGILLTFSFFLFTFALTSSAHEPITTKVRFNKEVVRIFQQSCLGCHHAGGIAMSLETYDEARPWAKAIKEEVLEKRMPPLRAVKGYGEFRNTASLTQREIDLIVNWVEGGAPKGDDKDLPAGPLFADDWRLGKPDVILKPENEINIAADADEYRTVVLATNLKEDRWLSAIDLLPGNGSVVHCAKIHLLKNESAGGQPASMMQVKNDDLGAAPPPLDLQNARVLATWMPGQKTVALDGGVGELLPAGSRIAVKIHYRGAGEAAKDLSRIGLYFSKGPQTKELRGLTITGDDSAIPVGAALHQSKSSLTIPSDSQAIGIRPRVHPLVASLQATAYRPDGSQQVLIWTRGYQFDWGPTYLFKQPVALPKGTRVEVIVYYDNSESNQHNPNNPAVPVRWSELTADPWCVLLLATG
jgi:hypothetical protein